VRPVFSLLILSNLEPFFKVTTTLTAMKIHMHVAESSLHHCLLYAYLLVNILWRLSPMRELLKREASKQKKNECLELVPRWRAQQGKE
jgi:hypothetical protein